jgi:ATP-dependent protease ClpP protease subunit
MHKQQFWQFKAAVGDTSAAELLLSGDISEYSWWGEEVSPQQFDADLKALGDVKTITVRIHSYGGDVFAANAIHNMLVRHPAQIVTINDGACASAATIIYAAGTTRIAPANAAFLYHNPWTYSDGNAAELRKIADDLDRCRDTMLVTYEEQSTLGRDELIALMDEDRWMGAAEALEYGFVTEVEAAIQIAAKAHGRGEWTIRGERRTFDGAEPFPLLYQAADAGEPEPEAEPAEDPPGDEPEPKTDDTTPSANAEGVSVSPKPAEIVTAGSPALAEYKRRKITLLGLKGAIQ